MKVLIFGTGEYYHKYQIWFEDEEVLALIDNSVSKQGTVIDGRIVIAPEMIRSYEYDAVFVLTFSITSIRKQLEDLGVPSDKIHSFMEIGDLIYNSNKRKEILFYNVDNTKKEIVLLNMDMSLGGPGLALYNAAITLKEAGHDVTYASMIDGPLRKMLTERGISVIVDNNLMVETMVDNEWIKEYSLIICNTVNYHVFLSKRYEGIPTVWWLHDPLFFYEAANKEALERITTTKLYVYSVGPVAGNAISTFIKDVEVGTLLYGVDRVKSISSMSEKHIVKFVTIGFVEPHKGQDILINAISLLDENIIKRCRFIFAGKNVSIYAQELIKRTQSISEIEFIGLLDRDGINALLDSADMLICPSRQDCMPTVCAEAMMHKKPCIVSDVVGTAPYISPESGMVFESENAKELAEKITFAVNHSDTLAQMGEEAKVIFENYFSMDVFKQNVLRIVNDAMMSK